MAHVRRDGLAGLALAGAILAAGLALFAYHQAVDGPPLLLGPRGSGVRLAAGGIRPFRSSAGDPWAPGDLWVWEGLPAGPGSCWAWQVSAVARDGGLEWRCAAWIPEGD